MPANHKVSVAWQIVFTFIPILDLWAFYRIRKLQKYVLWVILPMIALSVAIASYYFYVITKELIDGALRYDNSTLDSNNGTQVAVSRVVPAQGSFREVSDSSNIVFIGAGIGFQGLSIYLIISWSRQHNRTFDTSA
jgi:hypothetical protein